MKQTQNVVNSRQICYTEKGNQIMATILNYN